MVGLIEDGFCDVVLGNRIGARREAPAGRMPLYKYVANRLLALVQSRRRPEPRRMALRAARLLGRRPTRGAVGEELGRLGLRPADPPPVRGGGVPPGRRSRPVPLLRGGVEHQLPARLSVRGAHPLVLAEVAASPPGDRAVLALLSARNLQASSGRFRRHRAHRRATRRRRLRKAPGRGLGSPTGTRSCSSLPWRCFRGTQRRGGGWAGAAGPTPSGSSGGPVPAHNAE